MQRAASSRWRHAGIDVTELLKHDDDGALLIGVAHGEIRRARRVVAKRTSACGGEQRYGAHGKQNRQSPLRGDGAEGRVTDARRYVDNAPDTVHISILQ